MFEHNIFEILICIFCNTKFVFRNAQLVLQKKIKFRIYKLCIIEFSFHNSFHTPPFLLRNQYSVMSLQNPIFENPQPLFFFAKLKKKNH